MINAVKDTIRKNESLNVKIADFIRRLDENKNDTEAEGAIEEFCENLYNFCGLGKEKGKKMKRKKSLKK